MAGLYFVANTAPVTTGTALKTLLQIVAPSNHRVLVWEWSISFNGVSNTGTPILVELYIQTTAGTMSSLTLVKENVSDDEAIQTTAQHTATAEPSLSSLKMSEQVHPQQGYTWPAPLMKPLVIPGGTRFAMVVTAAASVSAVARMRLEE